MFAGIMCLYCADFDVHWQVQLEQNIPITTRMHRLSLGTSSCQMSLFLKTVVLPTHANMYSSANQTPAKANPKLQCELRHYLYERMHSGIAEQPCV